MHFHYCPQCGAALTDRAAGDEGMVPYCTECSRYWFDCFDSCVIIMVINELQEVALLRQSYLSTEHHTFVAGYIKPGETAEETALREVREEIGQQVHTLEYAGTHWYAKRGQLMHAYFGYVTKAPLTLSSEVDDAMWVHYTEAEHYMFPPSPGSSQRYLYDKYLQKVHQSDTQPPTTVAHK